MNLSRLVLVIALTAAPSLARADDDAYVSLVGAGYAGQSKYTSVEFSGFVYPHRDSDVIHSWYMDAQAGATGFQFDSGLRVFKGLTIGVNAGIDSVSVSGPTVTGDGKETMGGVGLSAGWIAVQTKRYYVHPIAWVQRAGKDPNYGGRFGVEVHAVARIVKLFELAGLPFWLSAYGSARWSTGSSSDVSGNKTTFDQTYVVVGVTPIDWQF